MRDPTPDPALAVDALRYAAGDMPAPAAAAFEAVLAESQPARDALAEAVRLSAAASGVPLPHPDPLTREAVAERVCPTLFTRLFPRRPYRGHPALWATLGGVLAAGVVAAVLGAGEPGDPKVVRLPDGGLPHLEPARQAMTAVDPDVPPAVLPTAPTVARPLTPPTAAHPRLNPMGLDPQPGVTAAADCTPLPMIAPEPPPRPAGSKPAAKPRTGDVAESNTDPVPAGEPHIGEMMSRL